MERRLVTTVNNKASRQATPFAKRSFGQNFLVDETVAGRIVDAARLGEADTVVEIGPGRGALTRRLVKEAGRVIVVELDADLLPVLKDEFGQYGNFELINADVLKLDLLPLAGSGRVKIVANLPYYISTAVLQHLIAQRRAISEMVLMFQREVVDRIVAQPGNSERGYLTVLVEALLNVEKLFDVPPSSFKPAPKVWSSVVRLLPKANDPMLDGREQRFERLVGAAFRQKRKTILNNLKTASAELELAEPADLLARSEIDPSRRAETLSFTEWRRLFMLYAG